MSAVSVLHDMFRYNAWANAEFFVALEAVDPARRHDPVRLLNHCYVVNRIFAAHLAGTQHGYAASNTKETPALAALKADVAAMDRWYLDYIETVTPEALAQSIAFAFTDGDRGCMSRQEMLIHAAMHGAYHRGEVGRILKQVPAPLPWDTFAVYLHQAEPARRAQNADRSGVAPSRHTPSRAPQDRASSSA